MLVMVICMAGCNNAQETDTQELTAQNAASTETRTDTNAGTDAAKQDAALSDEQEPQNAESTAADSSDILVVYFSRTGEQYTVGVIEKGNTAIVAEMIAEQTGADSFEILPADDHYPMTYAELTDVAKREQSENARPAYAGALPDLSKYDTIFIGAPVWWGDWPMIMYTFFETNADALAGKTLIPFSTHEGSGLSGFDRKLASACPNSTVGEGLAIRGNDCQNKQNSVKDAVSAWLAGLGM